MISSRLVVRQQRFVGNFVEPFKTNLDQSASAMNQMQPVLRRAPPASVVLDRSARPLPRGTERYAVPGAGSVVVAVSAGDTVTVRDVEGCQPCELVFAGADGRVDPRGLGVPGGLRRTGFWRCSPMAPTRARGAPGRHWYGAPSILPAGGR